MIINLSPAEISIILGALRYLYDHALPSSDEDEQWLMDSTGLGCVSELKIHLETWEEAWRKPYEVAYSDDDLRRLWREAGGSFHGPRIEHGTMQEALLLPFLRRLLHHQAAGRDGLRQQLQAALEREAELEKAVADLQADARSDSAEQQQRLHAEIDRLQQLGRMVVRGGYLDDALEEDNSLALQFRDAFGDDRQRMPVPRLYICSHCGFSCPAGDFGGPNQYHDCKPQ